MRAIRVFVSSTFRDMHLERDALTRVTFPALRQRFRGLGTTVAEIDLRWGITEEDATAARVLPICLEEIDRCRPFFICVLGSRYGWTDPSNVGHLKDRYAHLARFADRSVTELEIRHALLNPPASAPPTPALIYVRRDMDTAAPEYARVQGLVHDLRAAFPDACHEYSSADHLAGLVGDHLGRSIARWHESPSAGARDETWWRELTGTHLTGAIRRPHIEERVHQAMAKPGSRVALVGARGSGKTTVLATVAHAARGGEAQAAATWMGTLFRRKASAASWIVVIESAMGRALDWRTPVAEIVRQLDPGAAVPADPERLLACVRTALLERSRISPVAVVVDGLDDMEQEEGSRLTWLQYLVGPRISMAVSCTSDALRSRLEEMNFDLIEVPFLTRAEAIEASRSYLSVYGKRLTERQAQSLVTGNTVESPALLRLRLDELRLHGVFENLEAEISRLAAIPDLEAGLRAVVARVSNDRSLRAADASVDLLALLASSRSGLSDSEILELLAICGHKAVTQRGLTELYIGLGSIIAMRAGHARIASAPIASSLLEWLPENRAQALSSFFARDPASARAVEELPALWIRLSAWEELARFLTNGEVLKGFERWRPGEIGPLLVLTERNFPGHVVPRLVRIARDMAASAETGPVFEQAVATLLMLGRADDAQALAQQALQDSRTEGGRVAALAIAAHVATMLGRFEESLRYLLERQSMLHPVRDAGAWVEGARSIAEAASNAGNIELALEHSRLLVEQCVASVDHHGLRQANALRADLLLRMGALDESARLYSEQRDYADRYGDLMALQGALGNLGLIARLKGRPREALRLHAEEELICRSLGDSIALHVCLGNQGLAAVDLGDLDRALKLFETKLALAASSVDRAGQVEAYEGQALVFERLGQGAVARELRSGALALAREHGLDALAGGIERKLRQAP